MENEGNRPLYWLTEDEWQGFNIMHGAAISMDSAQMQAMTEMIQQNLLQMMKEGGIPESVRQGIIRHEAQNIRRGIRALYWMLDLMERDGILKIDYPPAIDAGELHGIEGTQDRRSPDHSMNSPDSKKQNHQDE